MAESRKEPLDWPLGQSQGQVVCAKVIPGPVLCDSALTGWPTPRELAHTLATHIREDHAGEV